MKEWGLSEDEQLALDEAINTSLSELDAVPEGWKHYIIRVPEDFYQIMKDTIEAYKILRETDKTFPAIEAIFLEARNSLPQEIIEQISQKQD